MEFANFGGLFCPRNGSVTTHRPTNHHLYHAGWTHIHHSTVSTALYPASHPCIISDDIPPKYGIGWHNHIFIDSLPWPLVIVDNHHHVLPWRCHRSLTHQQKNTKLTNIDVIHIDAHADLGPNPTPFPIHSTHQDWRIYTHNACTIATFINPAHDAGIINQCIQIRSLYKRQELATQPPHQDTIYILDIDCDFWDKTGWIHEQQHSLTMLKTLITSYPLLGIDIATSPLFLDQNLAHTICCTLVDMIAHVTYSSQKH